MLTLKWVKQRACLVCLKFSHCTIVFQYCPRFFWLVQTRNSCSAPSNQCLDSSKGTYVYGQWFLIPIIIYLFKEETYWDLIYCLLLTFGSVPLQFPGLMHPTPLRTHKKTKQNKKTQLQLGIIPTARAGSVQSSNHVLSLQTELKHSLGRVVLDRRSMSQS